MNNRQVKFRKDSLLLWAILVVLATLVLIVKVAHASDYHQGGQGHVVTVSITDTAGDPVAGQTPRVAMKRMTDGLWLDFNDNTFKAPGSATTLFQGMTYDTTGGFYYRVITVDNATAILSMDCVVVISNDNATYGFTTTEGVAWDNLNKLIKINR